MSDDRKALRLLKVWKDAYEQGSIASDIHTATRDYLAALQPVAAAPDRTALVERLRRTTPAGSGYAEEANAAADMIERLAALQPAAAAQRLDQIARSVGELCDDVDDARDAARYRWLRAQRFFAKSADAQTIEETIDAALAAQGEQPLWRGRVGEIADEIKAAQGKQAGGDRALSPPQIDGEAK